MPKYKKDLKEVETNPVGNDTKDDKRFYAFHGLALEITKEAYDKKPKEYQDYYKEKKSKNEREIVNEIYYPDPNQYELIPENVPPYFVKSKMRESLITELKEKINILTNLNVRDENEIIKLYDDHISSKFKNTITVLYGQTLDNNIKKEIQKHVEYLFNDPEDSLLVNELLLHKYPGKEGEYQYKSNTNTLGAQKESYNNYSYGGTRTPKPRSKKHKIQKRPTKRRRHQIKRSRRNKK